MRMKLCSVMVIAMNCSVAICYGADKTKTDATKLTPEAKEYYKNAGKPADPSAEDYLATKAKQDARNVRAEELRKTAVEMQKAKQREKADTERRQAELARKRDEDARNTERAKQKADKQSRAEEAKRAEYEKHKAEQEKRQEEQTRMKQRRNNSPSYQVPDFDKKGSYGKAK